MDIGRQSVAGLAAPAVHSALDDHAADGVTAAEAVPATISDLGNAAPAVLDGPMLERLMSERVARALSARGLSSRQVRQPSLDLLASAAEAVRFAPGKQEIANLIASAMDPKFGSAVLPSHVDVLKQLTLDELALLRVTPPYGFSWPVSDLIYILASGQILVAYRNIVPQQLAAACVTPGNVPQYIDNLARLRLVYSAGEEERAEEVRRLTVRVPFVRRLIARRPAGSKAGIQTMAMRLTDFGEQFRLACLY